MKSLKANSGVASAIVVNERVGTHGRVQARIGIAKERSITHGRVIGRQRYYLKEPTRRWRCCSTDSVGEQRADAYSGIFACDIKRAYQRLRLY